MHSKVVLSLLAAVLLTLFASAGCSARRTTAAAGPPFRLGVVYGRPVLFAPSVPESNPNSSAINLEMDASRDSSAPADCLAANGPFRVELAKKDPPSIQIAMPSPERWIRAIRGANDPEGDALEALFAVLAELEPTQPGACFKNTGPAIREFLLQSLPMEPTETLFNYYGYRSSRNGLALKPGMRLKVERAYVKADSASRDTQSSENQEGVSFVYFGVESSSDGKIQFRREGDVHFTPASLKKKFQSTGIESELGALQSEARYRLVLYGLNVPTERKLSASIIGTTSSAQLDEFEQVLRSHPTDGCKNFAATTAITCLDFTGWVTATPQITVELNGKSKFVDCGTLLRDVVPESALGSLTIQRKFLNSYRDIRFKPGDTDMLGLTLVGGDRLSWSKTASGSP